MTEHYTVDIMKTFYMQSLTVRYSHSTTINIHPFFKCFFYLDFECHSLCIIEHSNSQFDSLCESIRLVKNQPFDSLVVMQFFSCLFIV